MPPPHGQPTGPLGPDHEDLALLATLLPPAVVLRQCGPGDPSRLAPPALHAQERAAVERAVPSRRLEFALGRHCARQALQALCGYTGPVPAGADRSPQWPPGVVGSITHDEELAAAAVARAADLAGLGIDIDRVHRFDDSLARTICSAPEWPLWVARPAALRAAHLALLFCAKEAVYKAQYPVTAAWMDFADLQVEVPVEPQAPLPARGRWQAVLQRPVGPWRAGHVFAGDWAASPRRVAAACLLTHADMRCGGA